VAAPPLEEGDGDHAQWVTTAEAAAVMGLSVSGFRALARREGIRVRRRGALPGVHRPSIESYMARAGITARRALTPPDQDWLPLATAAKQLGISRYLLQQLIEQQGVSRVRPDGRPGIPTAGLNALLTTFLIRPGSRRGVSNPSPRSEQQ